MARLEAMGTEQNRKVYRRHGAGDYLFGVSQANLHALRKRIKKDHALASGLWATGNMDARSLATMIADPWSMSTDEIEGWLSGLTYYNLVDLLVRNVVSKSTHATALLGRWTRSDDEYTGQAGWELLAIIAMNDRELDDPYFAEYLERIERGIHAAKDRTRHAMNNALIAIGMRNDALRERALAAARAIGKVVVDHGETGCVTPDAASYIKKAADRARRRVS
jgi:3-methyladenine DNA glycosylase AlkD